MPRPSKAVTALVRAQATPLARLDSAAVERLTARFLELKREAFRNLVDRAVELGEILIEARPMLQGQYGRWLRERLGVDPTTAENYVALARLSRAEPQILQRWKELGPSKLYRVARLPPQGRRAVLRTREVDQMNDLQFASLVSPWVKQRRRITGNMRAHGLRMRVRAFDAMLARTALPAIEDAGMRAGLRAELAALAGRLRTLAAKLG